MRARHIVTLLLPLLLIVAVVVVKGRTTRDASSAAEPQKLIDAPTEWVAFTADFAKGYPGQEAIQGRFFRASDGSERLETGPVGDTARVVFIKNVPQSTYYSRRMGPNGVAYWISGPMKLPPDGWKPTQMTEAVGRRVVLPEKVEGFSVVQIASTGSVSLFAPSLNYHPLVRRHAAGGYQERYGNVKLGEPALDLFVPPTGDEVRRTEKTGGITFSMPGDAPPAK